MAQDSHAPPVGAAVTLCGATGPFRVCGACGSERATVAEGSGPHVAALDCAQCGRHLAWLSHRHLTALAAAKGAA